MSPMSPLVTSVLLLIGLSAFGYGSRMEDARSQAHRKGGGEELPRRATVQ